MALAHLGRLGDDGHGRLLFEADIGTNRYYGCLLGGPDIADRDGFPYLADAIPAGPLRGPLPEQALGRTRLSLPAALFTEERPCIQLVSYRELPDIGPALSEPVHVGRPARTRPHGLARPDGPQGGEQRMNQGQPPWEVPVLGGAVQPFSYEESVYSQEMFLQSLAPVLNIALPLLGKLLPSLGGLGGLGGAGSAPATAPTGSGGGTDVLQQLLALLLNKLKEAPAAPPGAPAQGTAPAVVPGPPVLQASLVRGGGRNGLAPRAGRVSRLGPYSEDFDYARAMNPMLLAAMPLIEKALNPETLKAIGGLSASSQAQAAQEQVRQHLERILPSSDTTAIYQLLALLSQQASTGSLRAVMPDYTPAPGAELTPDPAAEHPAVTLNGRVRRLYRTDRACSFPLRVTTPRPIEGARVRWQVRLATSADALIDEERPLARISGPGPVPLTVQIPAADMARLAPGVDHVLCAYVLWESRGGRALGVETLVPFTPVGPYAYDGIGDAQDGAQTPVLLDDVDRHRAFWHKVWQTTLSDETFRYQYECKYYLGLDQHAHGTARGVTRIKDDPRDLHTQTGRLEAALRMSLDDLNRVLGSAAGREPLDGQRLAALRTADFAAHFSAAGRSKVRCGGRPGTSVALWVFPELLLRTVQLRHCAQTDAHGRVTDAVPERLLFPFPAAVHFVGVTTDQDGG